MLQGTGYLYLAVWFLSSCISLWIWERTGHLLSMFKLQSTYVLPSFVLWLLYQTFCAYVSIVSQSDCYVSLWLPTASDEKFQTKTIKNCRDPVWNETFYFWIQRKIKVPKVLISSVCSFFWFKPKQDVNTCNAYLSLRKVLASWSEHLWLLLLPSSRLLFVCSLSCLLRKPMAEWRYRETMK